MNPGYQESIISALKRSDIPAVHSSELAEMLQVPPEDHDDFEAAVDALGAAGRLIIGNGRMLSLPAMGSRVVGRYRQTSRGFGFIIPDEPNAHGDLFIPAGENMDAVTGDIVAAKVIVREKYDTRDRKNIFGRVVEILKRATNRVVGTLQRERNRWYVVPDGTVFRGQVLVADVTAKSAKENDKVVVELMKFPRDDQPAEGVILEVLGERGAPEVELQSVLRQFELPAEFPAAVMDQAAEAARSFDPEKIIESGQRQDLSDETIITIDPDDARDFDDAISLRVLRNQRGRGDDAANDAEEPEMDSLMAGEAIWELGVHIADVSHFVPAESPMDMEARTRGNSTYFPRYVIPMLPEILSNGVCSLQEGVYRLTKSAFIRYDARGNVVGTRFANTIIKSSKRLTYTQAQAIIDDAKGEGKPYSKGLLDCPINPNVPDVAAPVRNLLVNMDRLARLIRQRRLEAGMMVLDLPEVELVMDDEGRVIDARPEDDAFTHKIIEMFMVEANEAVARWLTRQDLPVLRRVHPEPDAITAEQVRQFLLVAGRKVPKILDRSAVQALLSSVKGTPVSYAVNLAVLKTFTTAEYSPVAVGHYALASDNYAHFTSPIRRYADLVIHRAFNAVVSKQGKGKIRLSSKSRGKSEEKSGVAGLDRGTAMMPEKLGDVPDVQTLTQLGKYLSFTERRSSDAERELRAVKVLQLLAEHAGDVIDGVITGVTNFGVFVQSTRFLVEGMIRTADLPDDFWQFDERIGILRGQRTGRRIAIGDRARVQIVSVNIPARQLDLRLLEHGSSISGDTALRQMQPRRQPKPYIEHDGENSDGEAPEAVSHVGRKKNLAKRQERKRQQQLAKQQKKNNSSGRRGRNRGRRR